MNLTLPFYDGDGTIRRGPSAATAPAAARPIAPAGALTVAARAIAGFIGTVLRRIEQAVSDSRRRQVEAYLARSADLVDLERRMRSLERKEITLPF